MSHTRSAARSFPPALLLAAGLCACGGGETESATAAFTSSGCKSKPAAAAVVAIGTEASTVRVDLDLGVGREVEGLTCVQWERVAPGSATTFRLYNVAGGCGAAYDGKSTPADDGRTVKLSVTNPSGAIAACGSCLYDFAFTVPGVAATGALTVELFRSNTAAPATDGAQTFRLETTGRASGITCTHTNRWALQDHARKTGRLGARNMPCGTVTGEEVACKPGLACTAVPGDDAGQVCLAACEADADCPHPEAYACDARLCRPRPAAR